MSERLKQELTAKLQSMLRLVKQQGTGMHALRQYAVKNNLTEVQKMLAEIQGIQCSLQAEANGIEVELKAATSLGEADMRQTVRAEELELHPLNHGADTPLAIELPPARIGAARSDLPQRAPTFDEIEAMQRTLHRSGDHTQDITGDDRNVATIGQKGGQP